jgi:hypothetical protein
MTEYKFFSSLHGMFIKNEYILDPKATLIIFEGFKPFTL